MKRFFFAFVLIVFNAGGALSAADVTEGISLVVKESHPRLFANDKDFAKMRRNLNSARNKYVLKMHDSYIAMADKFVSVDRKFEESSNNNKMLDTSRKGLKELAACAYAWRFTGKSCYFDRAESILNDLLEISNWHLDHYLALTEMATAVAIGYDWLYKGLSKEMRHKCEVKMKENLFDVCVMPEHRPKYQRPSNWGQVLNGGLVVSAIAMYDIYPEICDSLLRRSINDITPIIKRIYAPDGMYPEGVSYWSFGTSYQILGIAAMDHCYGHNFGLSDTPGFSRTGRFRTFGGGNLGLTFNYSDCVKEVQSSPELWWFAAKFNDPSILYPETLFMNKDGDKYQLKHRLGAVFLISALKSCANVVIPEDKSRVVGGSGRNPLFMARTGWEKNDLYLGIKGGCADNGHSHMDAGSFVFEAYGVRWSTDRPHNPYDVTTKAVAKLGGNLWARGQESYRWKLYGYNNMTHSTLTINGHLQDAIGTATLSEMIDEPGRIGGRLDLTPVYHFDAALVERTALIRDDSYLEISDRIVARDDMDADVRWTLNAYGRPELEKDGITLSAEGIKMKIHAEGTQVKYTLWPHNPQDYPEELRELSYPQKGCSLLGFTFTVPAGKEVTVTTTICRNK